MTQPDKTKGTTQPKKAIITEPSDKTCPSTDEVTVEEITETSPSKQQAVDSSPLQPNPSNTSQEMSKKDKPQDQDKKQEENLVNKEKTVIHNPKIQSEKPFDLEAEIGRLKVAIPLSVLAKHDIYRQQIKKSLQITRNKDNVNVLDDTPELVFGPEVDGKTAVTGILPFYVSLHQPLLHN